MSNVPVWQRNKENEVQYIYNVFQINCDIGHLVHITAKKYRSTYGEKLISMAADALVETKTISRFRAYTKEEIAIKLDRINKALSIIESIATVLYVWVNNLVMHDGIDQKFKDKLYRMEYKIGVNANDALDALENLKWSIIQSNKKKQNN